MTGTEVKLAVRCVVLEYRLSHVVESMPVGIGGAYLRFTSSTSLTPEPGEQVKIMNLAIKELGL